MLTITKNLHHIQSSMQAAEKQYGRAPNSTQLIAVSKQQPLSAIQAAYQAGQTHFGENRVQEAQEKINQLATLPLIWHFIGPIQSNKTSEVAKLFHWVHGVDRLKIAIRLSQSRPQHLPPLQLCIQVNLDLEPQKAGVTLQQLPDLLTQVATLPNVNLRGLMCIPKPFQDPKQQHATFAKLRLALLDANATGLNLDTLSMGMSKDYQIAIAEGATFVRIGAAIFGPRP